MEVASVDYVSLLAEMRLGASRLQEAETKFKLLVETIPGVAYVAEPGEHGAWHYISPRLEQVLGYPAQDWIDDPSRWIELIHPEDRARVLADEETWVEVTGGVHIGEYRLLAADGSYRWIRDAATARPGGHVDENPVWFGVLSDITQSREAEEASRRSERLLRSVLDTAQDAFVAVDGYGVVLEWNRRAESMFGWRRDEAMGRNLRDLFVPERRGVKDPWADVRAADMVAATTEVTAVRADGSDFPTEVTLWHTGEGPDLRWNAFIRDITERHRLQHELRSLAFTDALTGLANRAQFQSRLDDALSGRPSTAGPTAVLFFDVDDFKTINDSLGHAAGDRLLTVFAERVRQSIRPTDLVARMSGDEFAVLLPEVSSLGEAVAVAERIGARLREPLQLDGVTTVASVSIGIASTSTGRALGGEDLLRDADAAMYHAKRSGKNRAAVYDPGLQAAALERLELQSDLSLALERHEFSLAYQPYFDLTTEALAGFEALLRWHHPTRGSVSPGEFIPRAEESGLIQRLGGWALHRACEDAVSWDRADPSLGPQSVNVNVSSLQIQEPGFLAEVDEVLERTGLDPGRLVLEITEGLLVRGATRPVAVLTDLRQRGVRIAIDDFGTGYSSLSYLQRLPIDILKIDKGFVDPLTDRPAETSMAKVIVQMGQALGLEVVAEGVERAEQLDALRALQCDAAQGFYLGRPMSPRRAAGLVTGGARARVAGNRASPHAAPRRNRSARPA